MERSVEKAQSTYRTRLWGEIGPLVALAVPLVFGLTTSTLIGLIDTYMLGDLGATVLAAVSLTSSALVIFYSGLYGLAGPIGILVGQAHGAEEPVRAAHVVRHGLVLALLGGLGAVILMGAGYLLLPHIDQPPEVIDVITPYWAAMSLSLIPFTLSLVFKQFYDAIDKPWLAFGLMVLALVANVFVNWLLIDGNLGFPALGLTGAGIGSFAGQMTALVALVAHFTLSASTAPYRVAVKWSSGAFREQWREGMPMAVQYFLEGSSVAFAGIMIGWLGTLELAATQIVNGVGGLLYMLPLGMAGAVTIRVAQAMGRRENGRLPPITYAALLLVSVWTLGFTAVLLLGGEAIARLFVTEPELIAITATVFITVGFMQVFDGLQSVSLGALRGMLDNRWPTVVSLVGYWLVALPVGYVVGVMLDTGAAGVWMGFASGLVVASVLLVWRIRWQFQRIQTVTEQ